MPSQYETNLWSTHVNIVRLAEPIRRYVRWRTQVFKIEGYVSKRFLPSPPPPPSFTFWLSFHFSRGQNRKSPSSVFFCSETKRKRLLRRLMIYKLFFSSYLVHKRWLLSQASLRRPRKLGIRIVAWPKPRLFCEESLGLELFRNGSVNEFYRLKTLITLK